MNRTSKIFLAAALLVVGYGVASFVGSPHAPYLPEVSQSGPATLDRAAVPNSTNANLRQAAGSVRLLPDPAAISSPPIADTYPAESRTAPPPSTFEPRPNPPTIFSRSTESDSAIASQGHVALSPVAPPAQENDVRSGPYARLADSPPRPLPMSDPAELLSTQPTAKDLSRQDGVWSPQVVHAAPAPANVSPVYPHTSMSANYLQSPMPAPAAQQAAAITPIGAPFAAASIEPRPSFAAPVSPADLNRPAAQYASPAPSPPLRTHTIIDGDSLTKLAGRYLRDPARSDEIFALNRDVLENPDLLPIGAELKLPAVNATGRGG